MTAVCYDIDSRWLDRPEAPAEIGNKFLRTLDVLERIDPIFSDWGTGDIEKNPTGTSIDQLRPSFPAFVESCVNRDDWNQPNPDGGYWLWASNDFRSFPRANPRSMNVHVVAGSKSINHCALHAGQRYLPPDPSVITYPMFKSALLATVSIWPAPTAGAKCVIWDEGPPRPPGEAPVPDSGTFPWMFYLNAKRTAHIDPPREILTERTPDGGLLMIAAETRFDPADREHMARSQVLAEIMDEHGGVPGW
jgi:hypothetical protein